MPVVDHLDIATKRIYLAVGVRAYHPVDDLYKEVRALRRTDETLRTVQAPLVASGNVPKGGGKFTPRLVTFRNGWRVVPEDTTHVLNVTGEQITDDGQSGPACFDLAPLSPASKVIIQYEPPAAEVIVIETAGGADWSAGERAQILAALDAAISSRAIAGDEMPLVAEQAEQLRELYRLAGLDPVRPLVVGKTSPTQGSRTVGLEIIQSIEKDGNTVTVTRQ